MRSLPEVQHLFGAALADTRRAAGALPLFRGDASLNQFRLAIYRGNVYASGGKALASAYPIVRKIVGAAFFDDMAREFMRARPSASGDLNEYGEQIPTFLARFPPTQDLPYLPHVAHMEWLAHRAYFAADAGAFDHLRLAALPPERQALLQLALAPACAVMASRWPLERIWTVHQDDYQGDIAVDLDAGPDYILVHRPRWRAQVTSLGREDYRLLSSAQRGATLAVALQAALAEDPEFDLARSLRRWIDAGVIAEFHCEEQFT